MARFDCAEWKPIGANTGGRIGPNLGLILHHAVAYGSLWSFFNNPTSEVSAHFWVALDGRIEQYVDTDVVAWHGRSLNSRYVGVETEGCGASFNYAEPMTQAMVNALARIYGEGNRRHGWAYTLANADGQPGFGYHRMAVNTACPCDIRLARRQEILNIAQGQPAPKPPEPPKPPPTPEDEEMGVSQVVQRGNQLHCFHVPAKFGQLWHKWSGNNGLSWSEQCLISPLDGAPVKVATKLLPNVAASVTGSSNDQTLFCVTEEEAGTQWVCRQKEGQSWDIRRMAPGA
jgi:hypothetical protein